MQAQVLVEVKTQDKTFTYKIPENMNIMIGQRVLVPFGNRKIEGFVLKIEEDKEYDYKLKNIAKQIDLKPVLNKEMLSLGKYISQKTLSPLITAYQSMLPRALKAKSKININKKILIYLIINKEVSLERENQKKVYNYIKENKIVLKSKANKISSSAVKTLLSKEIIKEVKKEQYRIDDNIKEDKLDFPLTQDQKKVLENIKTNEFKPYLIHGVTGSGKTYVYIKLIEKVLNQNKQAVLLVPEISLTPQMVKIFKKHFTNSVALLHSGLSDGEKYDEWRKIEKNEVSIVIGARSAIFAPFTNIGIIIIDEEHASTYKQDSTPKYKTVDIALKRAKDYKCPLVLGSATPSVESYTRAKMGIYTLLEMKERVNHNLPKVHLVDMQKEYKKGNRVLSELLINKINNRLDSNQQVMILLNRRGYSTVITCQECGYTHKCPNCDIPYTYHKSTNSMHCHYCDKIEPRIITCPKCKSKNINSLGMGTEKLESLIQKTFSKAKTIRMDIDTTRNKGAHSKIIDEFSKEKYNILVGTQMISKGLDFPNVTLVAMLNADASLNIPDFRSAERTYQLVSQVAGRSGRSNKIGEVIIQGFNLDHYSILAAKNHNYNIFYNNEIKIRKALKYPPFYNLSYIKISHKDEKIVETEAHKIATYLHKQLPNEIILGPSYTNIPKINNIYYMGIIVKYKDTKKVLQPFKYIINKYYNNKVNIDIDLTPIKI